LVSDLDLGTKMILRNKLSFIPHPARPPRKIKPVLGAQHAVAYYPGCSLHSTAPEFDTSTKAVCAALDLELIEPKGWLCCGSSAAHKVDPEAAVRLPMENLAIIEQSGFNEVTMPCAMCFNRHKFAQYEVRHDEDKQTEVDEAIGYHYQDNVQVNTLIDTIHTHIGPEELTERTKKPLDGLRLVSYYGCLITRPPEVTEAPHHENPVLMDELMSALGAEVLDWSYKTTCCGASLSLTRSDIVLKLSRSIIEHARAVGADAIVLACPMCHANLDGRQFQMELDKPMPILYFTQLMALALGLPHKASAFNKNLVDPRPLLEEKGLIA
jgi:heterodisulfide reductase subunit B